MADEVTTEETEETEETSETEETEETEEKETEGDETEEEEEVEEFTDADKNLLKLLKDPKTSEETIKYIARASGIDLSEVKDGKAESKKVSNALDELGPDYEFITKPIQNYIKDLLTSSINEIKQEVSGLKGELSQKDKNKAEKDFFRENPDANKYKRTIKKLASKYPLATGQDPSDYLHDMYNLAVTSKRGVKG
jgi:hypothetical protein